MYGGGADVKGMATLIPGGGANATLKIAPLLYDGKNCSLIFRAGEVLATPQASLAPYGIWVAQPSNDVKLDCGGDYVVSWPVK